MAQSESTKQTHAIENCLTLAQVYKIIGRMGHRAIPNVAFNSPSWKRVSALRWRLNNRILEIKNGF